MKRLNLSCLLLGALALMFSGLSQAELQVGQPAPTIQLLNQDGVAFDLNSRKGKGWTVVYFYPKAGTPGCTAQACAFRDAIERIRRHKAEVYGVSTDSVAEIAAFHREHRLKFDLLSDPQALVTEAYGVKMPMLSMAKRWTFIIGPDLMVRAIDDDVDPALDAQKVAEQLQQLQGVQ